jgi:hypothetical protein
MVQLKVMQILIGLISEDMRTSTTVLCMLLDVLPKCCIEIIHNLINECMSGWARRLPISGEGI